MQALSEIQIVIAITLLLLVISSFVVIFIIIYQSRYHKHLKEKETLKQELLKTELEIQEDTMQTIAQEIHDNIGQILSLCKLHLTNMALDKNNPAHDKITASKDLLSKAIIDLRDLSKTLNKSYIANEPLLELFKKLLLDIERVGMHQTHLQVEGTELSIESGKQIILFRMVQESLQNIIKHANAKNISIHINYSDEKICIAIQDDGNGFDTSSYVSGNGIYNMCYKAGLIGATYAIKSKIGAGTLVEISLSTH